MTFPEADVPPALRTQVAELQDEAWPPESPSVPGTFAHDPALRPVSMLLVDGPTVLAALDVLTKELDHDGARYRAAGLSTVVTRGSARGQGHGRRLVTAAHAAMAGMDLDLGLFTCDRPLRAFYESAGWHHLPGAVLVGGTPADPFPSDRPGFDKVTMADFFSPRARRHRSAFRHSRIALYPGEIDKLW
ncbi:GNAT family N-acetyltransferase [Streptomyces angustmyceticus]|uniref:GNAT family N-acetyltransferase n=1 Tax=Streptomyces angustmyceticus TaxID=285578 RepID=UPI0028BD5DD6|nr:GNAT family N-acetyltransferase [Streptomyces angustmyceticus]